MKITVNRFKSKENSTISTISVDGEVVCFGLEDGFNETKIANETRIPCGEYKLKLREYGGFHKRYSAKFKFHKGMIEIANVPNYTDILIHIGNSAKDTSGCLLVGMQASLIGDMAVMYSTQAYKALYNKIIDSVIANEATITILDNDKAKN